MKKTNKLMRCLITFLNVISGIILISCEKSYPTYYDIDGEYVIDHVIVLMENVNGYRWDSVILEGTFKTVEPITPIDSFEVGITRFKFTDAGRTFYWDKQPNPMGGNPWRQKSHVRRLQDFLSGEWNIIKIDFELHESRVTRVLETTSVGINDFQAWIGQYSNGQNGVKIKYRYHFKEVGP